MKVTVYDKARCLFSHHRITPSYAMRAYNVYFRHWAGILEEIVRLINVWLITSLSLDKYCGICHPYFASSKCTPSMTKKIIIYIICFAIAFKLPK